MRSSFLFLLASLSLLLVPTGAHAQSAQPRASADLRLLRPLTLQRTADMNFGVLDVTTGGTATINPTTGVMTLAGGLQRLGGTVSPARYIGAATRLSVILIRTGAPTVQLRRVGGTETLTLGNLTLDGFFVRLVGAGTFEFAVGGQLSIPAGAPDGTYVGQLEVTAEYF